MLIRFWILSLLFLVSRDVEGQDPYESDDDSGHGVHISGNDQFAVYASNSYVRTTIIFAPYTSGVSCTSLYNNTDFYVYSLAVAFNKNSNELYTYVQIAEDMNTLDIFLSVITVNKSLCVENGNTMAQNVSVRDTLVWSGKHQQQYMLVEVDPSGNYAYVFADSFVLSFDIHTNRIVELMNMSMFVTPTVFIPHAFDLIDTWGIVVGFWVMPNNKRLCLYKALLIGFHPLRHIDTIDLNYFWAQSMVLASTYNRANDMSVSVNAARQMAIVGLPELDRVLLLSVNTTRKNRTEWTLNLTRSKNASQVDSGFGRSVTWLDDKTVAIVVLTVADRPWSQSEVWAFDVDASFNIPLFVFPNNQQTLGLPYPPLFLQIQSWSGSLYVQTEQAVVLLVPSRPAGHCSVWYDGGTDFIFVFGSAPCVAGTFKNQSGVEPCTVCPPETKNSADQPCTECSGCLSTSFCPLGSVADVSLHSYPSYTQTFTYPDSPDMSNYDDLLVYHIFNIGHSTRCLLISPLFWTIIAITLCFIIWLVMLILKVCKCQPTKAHRNRVKKFFKKTDLVGDGERWVGGLLSFAIVVLFGFTFWFATDYMHLYPIETSDVAHASCDQTLRNAVFASSLQLPLLNPDGTRWNIFDMLDAQPLTITVDFVNTRADCSSITVQQNRPDVNYLHIPIVNCTLQSDNVTRSLSFVLPAHRTSVQLNISGPVFVGGIRVCLRGPAQVDKTSTLLALNICQFFSTTNETLSRVATLALVLIKIINQTKPLKIGGGVLYSGRWAATFVDSELSDALIYEQYGNYLRYITERTTLTITLTEQPFFLLNNQQPIVRIAENAFHTLLFCTLVIEIFAMAFLLSKLVGLPLLRTITRCRRSS